MFSQFGNIESAKTILDYICFEYGEQAHVSLTESAFIQICEKQWDFTVD